MTVCVIGSVQPLLYPGIQQYIAGAGIVAADRLIAVCWRQNRDIGESTDIDDGPGLLGMGKHGLVECRYQRRALTASGQVAPAEIGNGGNTAAFGQCVGVADLQGEGRLSVGAVADRLAMVANSRNV